MFYKIIYKLFHNKFSFLSAVSGKAEYALAEARDASVILNIHINTLKQVICCKKTGRSPINRLEYFQA
jgi:hypothetical protein